MNFGNNNNHNNNNDNNNNNNNDGNPTTNFKLNPFGKNDNNNNNNNNGGGKQGHVCFGICDSRRATIIVNIINCLFLGYAVLRMYSNRFGFMYNRIIPYILMMLIGNIMGIYGAMSYNICLVVTSAAVYVVEFLMGFNYMSIMTMLYAGAFLYPHITLINEIHKGIMKHDTYEQQEKYSCCCV